MGDWVGGRVGVHALACRCACVHVCTSVEAGVGHPGADMGHIHHHPDFEL